MLLAVVVGVAVLPAWSARGLRGGRVDISSVRVVQVETPLGLFFSSLRHPGRGLADVGAPTLVTAPAITGPAAVGQTLSVDTGTWDGSPTVFSYQWQSCSSGSCSDIGGQTSSTYQVQAGDVGDQLQAVVTASNASGFTAATSAPTSIVPDPAPAVVTAPAIAGTADVGQTLSVDTGAWDGSPTAFSYQWQSCASGSCTDLAGQTSPTYDVQVGDVGDQLQAVVTATNSYGSTSAVSAATSAVTGTAPATTKQLTVSGTPQMAQTLTADTDDWTGSTPMSFAFQWQRCTGGSCSDIPGATEEQYTVAAADIGAVLQVEVTATNAIDSTTATSAPTTTVTEAKPATTAQPTTSETGPSPPYYGPAVLANADLLGYWPLDETSGTTAYDQASSPANGSYSVGTTLGQPGAIQTSSDDAVAFNGSARVYIASVAKLHPTTSVTLEAWFKTTSSAAHLPILQDGPTSSGVGLTLSDGQVVGLVHGNAVQSAATYNDGNWHYAVLTWDSSHEALYVDGALEQPRGFNPVPETAAPSYGTSATLIGSDGSYYFTGSIDEPAIYGSSTDASGALSAGEIANHYASAISGPVETPLLVTAPSVVGKPLVGTSYTVTSTGSWNSSLAIYGTLGFAYQWLRCDYGGNNCSQISGATGASYQVSAADEKHALAVQVTASNSVSNASTTVSLSSIGGYRTAVLTDGGSNLAGYWPLDENYPYPGDQPVADISSNAATGTYLASMVLSQPGAIDDGSDTSASFANGRVNVPADAALHPTSSLTLEAWFETSSAATYMTIIQDGPTSTNGTGASLSLYDGHADSWIRDDSVESAATYNDGRWHYAVMTWDGTNEILYVDGVLVKPVGTRNPGPVSTAPSYGNAYAYVGQDGTHNYHFYGLIDEPAIYGSSSGTGGALSPAQVANHYRLGRYLTAPASWSDGGSNAAVPGLCGCAAFAGDPVNTASGDYSDGWTDVSAKSYGPSVGFSRTYDASLAQTQAVGGTPGALGYGWIDNWNAFLSINGVGAVTVTQDNGAQVDFYPPVGGACQAPYVGPGTSGSYCALPEVTASLSYDSGSSTYTFVTHPYQSYTFDSSGRLTGESGPGGAALSVAYNTPAPGSGSCPSGANSCTTISSASGRALVIASNSSHEVTSVIDPLGRTWTYGYCSSPGSTCSTGDLVSVTDPMGRVTSYTYDGGNSNSALKHDLLTITRPNGQPGGPNAGAKLVIAYDSSGRVISQTDPAGNETSFDYSGLGSNGIGDVVVTDPDGNQTQTSFYGGVLTSDVQGYGSTSPSTTSYSPDPSTLLDTSITDPNGTSSYSYDTNGLVTSSTDPLGQTASYSYNSFDEQTCAATAQAAQPCSSLSPPAPITAGAATISPPSGAPPAFVTYSEYDTDGNPIWTTAGAYAHGAGNPTLQRSTYSLYNGQSVTLGSDTDSCTASAPASSLPCAMIDPNGVATQFSYDTAGDLTSSATPDGNSGGELATTTYSYDDDGEQTSTTAPDGNLAGATAADYTTTSIYDDDGEVTSVTVGQTGGTVTPRTTSYGYDANGNRTSVTNPRSKTTTFTFDANDRVTLVTDPDGHATLTCYDGDGNLAQTVPPVGVAANSLTPGSCPTSYPSGYSDRLADDATSNAYNYLGEKTTTTTPAAAGQSGSETTTYAYDEAGQLTSVTAPPTSNDSGAPNQVTSYSYDDVGQLLTVTVADGTADAATTSYCYDPDGNKTATVPPDGNSSGVAACSGSYPYQTSSPYQTGYSYDSLGELVSRTRPATSWTSSGQTTSYSYDPADNLLASTDPNGVTTSNTYTPLNQLASVSYSGSSAPSVSYSYDANGNQLTMSDGSGTSSYSFDPFNELTSYQNGAGNTVDYAYNPDGMTSGVTYPLGAGASWATSDTVGYGYDDADLLTSISDFNGNTITIGNTADGLPNSLALGSSGDTITNSYDPTDSPSQITLAHGSSTLLQFGYSDVPSGAIGTETDTPSWGGSPAGYSYDAQSRVTQMTPGTGSSLDYGFDPSGNLTTLPTGASGSYDNTSELTSSTLSGTTTDYSYDADGERTQASQGGMTIVTAGYNGAQQLTAYSNAAADMSSASYDGDGLRQSDTTTPTGGSASSETFTWNPTNSIPQLLIDSENAYIYAGGNTPIEQVDLASGTVEYLVADSLGSVRGVVDTSGALTASTGYDAWGNPETSGGLADYTPFGFAGGYTDATGLIYLIHRYYDPQTGQFISVDPLLSLTDSAYTYGADDPVDLVDPTGNCVDTIDMVSPGESACAGIWEKLLERAFANKRTSGNIGAHGAFTRYVELLDHGDLSPRHVGAFVEAQRALQKTLREFQHQKCDPPDTHLFGIMKRVSKLPVPTPAQIKAFHRAHAEAGGGRPIFTIGSSGVSVRFGPSPVTILIAP